ncbi:MAG: stage III sporulation protein AF [Clostridia bacterium]|nr:stage III sporulation protein AF [Clostridia bacterium]
MNTFIITLISVALLGGIMGMLSPDGDTKKYVRFVGSLCVLCALASPIYGILSDGEIDIGSLFDYSEGEEAEYEDIYKSALAAGAKENAEAELKRRICESFELSEKSLDVSLTLGDDGEAYFVESAEVSLHSSAVFADPREISAFVNEICGCACTVVYG